MTSCYTHGTHDYLCNVSSLDVAAVRDNVDEEDALVPLNFLRLEKMHMMEQSLHMPRNIEGIDLYLTLVDSIEAEAALSYHSVCLQCG